MAATLLLPLDTPGRPGGSRWDEGYHVTAYFLQWLTERYGEGTVPEINELMKNTLYDERIFKTVTGRKVSKLWKLYKEHLGEGGGGGTSSITCDPLASESDGEGPSIERMRILGLSSTISSTNSD